MSDMDAVIPAYDPDPAQLAAAVASLRACAGMSRIVIVDDGSRVPIERAPEWGHGGVDPLSRAGVIELVRTENRGPSHARNIGLSRVGATWTLLLDADDEAIAKGVAAMVDLGDRLGVAIVLGAHVDVRMDASGHAERERVREVPPEWVGRTLPRAEDVFRPIALFSSTGVLVHRRVIDAGVRFDEGLRIGEDRDFFCRVAREVGPIGVCPEPVVRKRAHAGGLTGAGHLARRVRDHGVLLDRYLNDASRAHFRDATRWLIDACARAGVDAATWGLIVEQARRVGIGVPLKARVRRLVRR
ncbi:MAG: glycosyltransferase [Phycisphaerales bacterium]|jgi:glycosyltransferase involved in cell wall biosynthesis|nr:glycosyltransferase [Phycisphaerales bacterium]